MNWPLALKIFVLIQVSLLSSLGGINVAMINPAYVPMAKEFHITTVRASYQTTICIVVAGIAPFLWVPLSNKYGRRPVLLGTTLLAFVSILGSAYAKTFNQLVATRVFNGLFPAAFALGPAVVVDMFLFTREGGRWESSRYGFVLRSEKLDRLDIPRSLLSMAPTSLLSWVVL